MKLSAAIAACLALASTAAARPVAKPLAARPQALNYAQAFTPSAAIPAAGSVALQAPALRFAGSATAIPSVAVELGRFRVAQTELRPPLLKDGFAPMTAAGLPVFYFEPPALSAVATVAPENSGAGASAASSRVKKKLGSLDALALGSAFDGR